MTLLDVAVRRHVGHYPVDLEIVELLMDAGVQVYGTTLRLACREFSVPLLRLLARDNMRMLQEVSDSGDTLMHMWAMGSEWTNNGVGIEELTNMLDFLVAHGVPMDGIDENGDTPLLLAAADRSESMVMYLGMMNRAPHAVDVNHRNHDGLSALHMLIGIHGVGERDQTDTMKLRGEAIQELFKFNADPEIGRGDIDKRTEEDLAENFKKVRTPGQLLTRSDIPLEEQNDVEEPDFDVLVRVFMRYMQARMLLMY